MRAFWRTVWRGIQWLVVVVVACAMVAFVATRFIDSDTQDEGSYQPVPEPHFVQKAEKKPTPTKKRKATIAPSPAVQVYIPSKNHRLTISSKVHPLTCMPIIEPPTQGNLVGSVFGCDDFSQPGTNARDLTILSGHSSVRLDAAFNRLNKMGKSAIGKRVLVRTKKSGKRWLIYRIQSMHRPLKPDLPHRTDIWGKAGQPKPGRLVLVTCFMKQDGSVADYNLVMIAQFVGVR